MSNLEGSGIVTISKQGVIVSVDVNACSMFGYANPSDLVGLNVNVLMPSPYREQHQKYLELYQRTGQAKIIGKTRVVEALRKDGVVFAVDLNVSVATMLGDNVAFCGQIKPQRVMSVRLTTSLDGTVLICQNVGQLDYSMDDVLGKNVHSLVLGDGEWELAPTSTARNMWVLSGRHKRPVQASVEIRRGEVNRVPVFHVIIEVSTNENLVLILKLSEAGIIEGCPALDALVVPFLGYTKSELMGRDIKSLLVHLDTASSPFVNREVLVEGHHKDGSMVELLARLVVHQEERSFSLFLCKPVADKEVRGSIDGSYVTEQHAE
jgi:PAS domain S-box-containing protein